MAKKKIFILDTNVILHDFRCIYKFEENDLVIPIVVLEELDKMKKGADLISYNAREFTRELDHLAGKRQFKDGIPLGKGLGKLYVETGKEYSKKLAESFPEKTPDHRILAIADYVATANPKVPTILVSKDINLRMKAKSLGLDAEDYESDKVQNLDQVNDVIPTLEGFSGEIIQRLYDDPMGVSVDEFNFPVRL
jgi:PhoH-like ATPase